MTVPVTDEESGAQVTPPMPPLLRGRRRVLMVLLVVTALAHSACAVEAGLLVGVLLGDVGQPHLEVLADLAVLVLVLTGLGVTRYADRVIAEKLGQDYVRELRRGLVSHAMTSPAAPSLGITIARSTNDLASVRNWISMGIAPLVALVPLTLGSIVTLAVLDPALAAVVGGPLIVLGAVLLLLARPAFARARELRRRRGSLAARVSDTVIAATGIAAAGGVERELRALDRSGDRVVDAAVRRAGTAGMLRSVALVAPLAGSAGAAVLGAFGLVSTASVAVALTIIGILAGPVSELGRTVEYRQNYKAARRILAPLLAEPGPVSVSAPLSVSGEPGSHADPTPSTGGHVHVRGLVIGDQRLPDLAAEPGDRILFRGSGPGHAREVFTRLAVPRPDGAVSIRVDGEDLAHTGPGNRRRLIGYAHVGARLERGTIARAVRYRRPDLDSARADAALAAVGLAQTVAALPEGNRTVLRRGGEPLDRPEIARLCVARAMLGEPPLLLLEHIDDDLGADGREMLRELLAGYPGVVLIASERPETLVPHWFEWGPAAVPERVGREFPATLAVPAPVP